MKLKHFLFTFLLAAGAGSPAWAQSLIDDALVFSQENNGGTARFKAMGNAKTALGGDISTITGNPAGLGFFGRSDVSLTLNYNNAGNKVSYFGLNTSRNKDRVGVDHAGMVFHFPTAMSGAVGWQNFNIGLSYENTNTFTENRLYEGANPNNTIVNKYIDDAIDDQDEIDGLIKWKMIEKFKDKPGYFPIMPERGDKTQLSDVMNTGFNSRVALAFGANYNNAFYIGGTLGLTSFRYGHSNRFVERGVTKNRAAIMAENEDSNFADLKHEDYNYVEADYDLLDDYQQRTEGSGVDLKLGLLFKPAVDWNVGLTIATPTWITVDDYTDSFLEQKYFDENEPKWWDNYATDVAKTEDRYRIATPWKFALGLSKFFGRGLLSADVEYVDYGGIKWREEIFTDPGKEIQWDRDMANAYRSVANLRVGGEFLFTNALSGRAGYNYYGNPYKNADNEQYSISAGLGLKFSGSTYMDLTVVQMVNNYKLSPYILNDAYWKSRTPVADVTLQRTNAVLTLGMKF